MTPSFLRGLCWSLLAALAGPAREFILRPAQLQPRRSHSGSQFQGYLYLSF